MFANDSAFQLQASDRIHTKLLPDLSDLLSSRLIFVWDVRLETTPKPEYWTWSTKMSASGFKMFTADK